MYTYNPNLYLKTKLISFSDPLIEFVTNKGYKIINPDVVDFNIDYDNRKSIWLIVHIHIETNFKIAYLIDLEIYNHVNPDGHEKIWRIAQELTTEEFMNFINDPTKLL